MSEKVNKLDLASIRERLDKAQGRDYWRSLEEISAEEGFQDFLHREFPRQASEWNDGEGRREFLKLMSASLALAGLGACTKQPTEFIMPYVNQPDSIIPGKPQFYATVFTLGGYATGILVESHEGRPTKIEGNPQHPASLGSTDVPTQGHILNLYDPDRSTTLNYLGEIRSYGSFLTVFKDVVADQLGKGGAGLRVLTETITSPTVASQMKDLLAAFPSAKWYQYDPIGLGRREGTRLAFGRYLNTVYKFDQADVILAIDADFFCVGPGNVRYARDYASRRRVREGKLEMNRMYAVESTPSSTGMKADHRWPLRPSEIEPFTRELGAALGAGEAAPNGKFTSTRWFAALVKDLSAHKGSSIVIAGENQSAEVHALVHAINGALGNAGKTVVYTEPVEIQPMDQLAGLKQLCSELDAGQVEALLILGGNPAMTAPADLNIADKIQKAKLRVRLGLHDDETSALCQWHIPQAHELEAWGDARAFDGTISIIQPLIAPLYAGRSISDFLAALTENQEKAGYDTLREYWQKQHTGADFEAWWRRAVHDGLIADTALPAVSASGARIPPAANRAASSDALEVSFHADPYIYDGRFANNGWLQELPRPISRLTWDNAALMSVATAQKLGIWSERRIALSHNGKTVWASVWVQPGQPDNSIAVHLGFGRNRCGRAGNGAGFNGFALMNSANPVYTSGVELRDLKEKYAIAATQHHYLINNEGPHANAARQVAPNDADFETAEAKLRAVLRSYPIEEYKKDPEIVAKAGEAPPKGLTLYPDVWQYNGYAWGMSIDMTACIGCNACVAACQSENNIPVVGKEQVLNTREMHWLRVDRYYEGSSENPTAHFQPVPCMHCENAPCEVVCPVAATVHDQEGLNTMVYNRCVGTRYCSNNCPYKVRRFNFLLFSDWDTESIKLQKNPDVTVRSRGVMEKCTYCTQRIQYAKIMTERQERRIDDGEVLTACQAVCPTQAIVFGDMNDPNSQVAKLKKSPLNYGMLQDLNTRPRTTYLAELRNPNPEIESTKS
jgi:molybdopterin-containing oxidoreductase family iron-sulfur binding subunit